MLYKEPIGYNCNARIRCTLHSFSHYPFHLHEKDIEIICILSGTVTIHDSALKHELSYGDVYIFNPNDPHKILSDDPENIVLTLHIDKSHYEDLLDSLSEAYFICDSFNGHDFHLTDVKHLRFLLADIFTLYEADKNADMLLRHKTKELIEFLLEYFIHYTYSPDNNGGFQIIRIQNYQHSYKNYVRMYRVVNYVSEHFREKLSLEQISHNEYVTPSHLSRYIKQTLGLTFSQLVSLTRCEEAERILASSNMTIDRIAETVGFANRKHLASQFKRWFNMTPTEYRNSIIGDLNGCIKVKLQTFDYSFAKRILDVYLDEY